MGRRFGPLAAVLAAAMIMLTACGEGSDPNAVHYGLVTDSDGVTNGAVSGLSAGMELAAQARSYRTQIYPASDHSEDAVAAAFKAAADDGVQYVLCHGTEMEVPAANAQNAYKKSRFLLFDGVPQNAAGKTAEIRNNMMCITFNRESMGFLVGYGAVRGGMRKLAFLTGVQEDQDTELYLTGFLNGVGYAAQILGMDPSSVTVILEYAGDEELSPLRMTDARDLMDEGAEILVTDIEAFMPALAKAASSEGKPLASVGFDPADGTTALSSAANYQGVAEALLNSFEEDGKSFAGGSVLEAGAAENAVNLRVDYSAITTFTETDLSNVLDTLAQLETNAEGETAGLSEAGSKVTLTGHEPVTPNASAGLSSGGAANASGGDAPAEAA